MLTKLRKHKALLLSAAKRQVEKLSAIIEATVQHVPPGSMTIGPQEGIKL